MSSRNQEPGWGRSTARTVTWWCSQRARARAPAVSSRAGGRQGPTEMCTPDGMCISIVSREISWYFRGSSWVASAAAPTPPSPPLYERPCALQRAQPLPVGLLGHCARSDLARWWTSCCRFMHRARVLTRAAQHADRCCAHHTSMLRGFSRPRPIYRPRRSPLLPHFRRARSRKCWRGARAYACTR